LELSDGFADGDPADETAPTPVPQAVVAMASEPLLLPEEPMPAVQPSAPEVR
jgi:hypothetical protein